MSMRTMEDGRDGQTPTTVGSSPLDDLERLRVGAQALRGRLDPTTVARAAVLEQWSFEPLCALALSRHEDVVHQVILFFRCCAAVATASQPVTASSEEIKGVLGR